MLNYPNDPKFFSDLMLQRTNVLAASIGPSALTEWLQTGSTLAIEAAFSDERKRNEAIMALESDYMSDVRQIIQLFGDQAASSLVSIGPGNAVIETLLARELSGIKKVTLIDIEKTESHYHGFARKGSGYACLQASKRFMAENGVSAEMISVCNPLKTSIPNEPFDMLISILSMCFHYPCDDYVDYIMGFCKPEGTLIVDSRRLVPDPGLVYLLSNGFRETGAIDFPKFRRLAIRREY